MTDENARRLQISSESMDIAVIVDGFPSDVRGKLRDAVLRIADVYRANGISEPPPGLPVERPDGVIDLASWRRA